MTAKYVEELSDAPISIDAVLSDDDLAKGGLAPIQTWARTQSSKNALRSQRAKERAEKGEAGPARKQLNLQAPVDEPSREAIKTLTAELLEGRVSPEGVLIAARDAGAAELGAHVQALIDAGGLRARILRRILKV